MRILLALVVLMLTGSTVLGAERKRVPFPFYNLFVCPDLRSAEAKLQTLRTTWPDIEWYVQSPIPQNSSKKMVAAPSCEWKMEYRLFPSKLLREDSITLPRGNAIAFAIVAGSLSTRPDSKPFYIVLSQPRIGWRI